VSDNDTNTIKQISSTGTVTTFATGLDDPFGVAFDGSGNLFSADVGTQRSSNGFSDRAARFL